MKNGFLIPLNFMKCFMKGALELSIQGIIKGIYPLALILHLLGMAPGH